MKYILGLVLLGLALVSCEQESKFEINDALETTPNIPQDMGNYIKKTERIKEDIMFDDYDTVVSKYDDIRISELSFYHDGNAIRGMEVTYEMEDGGNIIRKTMRHMSQNLEKADKFQKVEASLQNYEYISKINTKVTKDGWINYIAVFNNLNKKIIEAGKKEGDPVNLGIPKGAEVIAFGGEVGKHFYNIYAYHQSYKHVQRTDLLRYPSYWDDADFDDFKDVLNKTEKARIYEIVVYHNTKFINGIKITFEVTENGEKVNKTLEHYSKWFALKDGAKAFTKDIVGFQEGEYLSQITAFVTHNKCLNKLIFYNNFGVKILEAGGYGGEEVVMNIPKGAEVVGFKGSFRGHLNQLAVYYTFKGEIGLTHRARCLMGSDDVYFDDFQGVVTKYESARLTNVEVKTGKYYIEGIIFTFDTFDLGVRDTVTRSYLGSNLKDSSKTFETYSGKLEEDEFISKVIVKHKNSDGIYKLKLITNTERTLIDAGTYDKGETIEFEMSHDAEVVAFAGTYHKSITNLAVYYTDPIDVKNA